MTEVDDTSVGLSSAEAAARLVQYGVNALPEPVVHPVQLLLLKLWAPVPWMLEATVVLELVLGKRVEAAVIGLLLLMNALLSLMQERKAESALTLLRSRLPVKARVRRDGEWRLIDAREVVPGDGLYLRMGDLVPADIRIVGGELSLDQSSLTGESLPVEAGVGSSAYAGAVVRHGEAHGEVTATGNRSYFGKTAELVNTARTVSHLQRVILTIVQYLVGLDAVLVVVLLVFAWVTGMPLTEMLPFALILLVASVPVALPATFTLATALGSMELAKSGVLVTRLSAIEEAAAMDVLLSDKTGTITKNELAVAAKVVYGGVAGEELLRLACYASDAGSQDPIDMAVLTAAKAAGVDWSLSKRLGFVPFDPATKVCEATVSEGGAEVRVVKGFPAAVAAKVTGQSAWNADAEGLEAQGYRVIAVAFAKAGSGVGEWRMAGLIALEDPAREDSKTLIASLQGLGVRVAMVTGDTASTAAAVAARVGIGGRVCTPEELKEMDATSVLQYDVFAGVYPEDKVKLVRLVQQSGHVCGMTGDGVNDAPALKQAEVGIAVANATDVAKAAASVVLTNVGLKDMVAAVETSRRIYQRMLTYTLNKIVKTIEIALFLSLGVMLTGTFVITPLLIVFLLFTNDFVTMSIATDHVSYSPQPDRWDIRTLMLTAGTLAAVLLVFSFGVFYVGQSVLRLPVPELQTLVFVMLVFSGQGSVYLVRERRRLWASRPSGLLMVSSVVDVVLVSVLAANGIMMTRLPWLTIASVFAAMSVYLIMMDSLKVWIFQRLAVR